jgi:hypothetical protein
MVILVQIQVVGTTRKEDSVKAQVKSDAIWLRRRLVDSDFSRREGGGNE